MYKLINIIIKNWAFALIIIVALLVRLIGINRGIWNDEEISLNSLHNNIFLNPFYYGYTTNLPLFFILLKFWTFFGILTNLIYIRSLGIFLNIINIVVLYRYFKKINKERLGIIISFLICISPLQIHYAQEIRPYILTQLLISIHFIETLKYINSPAKNLSYKIAILTIFLFLSHYAAYLYLSVIFMVVLVVKNKTLLLGKNLIKLLILFLLKLVIIAAFILNPKFMDSLKTSNVNNYVWTYQSFIEMSIRIKEVLTFYYYFGFWYYLTSPVIQSLFKKTFLLFLIVSIFLVLIKTFRTRKYTSFVSISTFVLLFLMIGGLILEKLGLYPFGGRHIMPFSIFLYFLIGNMFNSILDIKNKIINILVFSVMISLLLVFIFHQSCVTFTSQTKPNIKNSQTYDYCKTSILGLINSRN